MNYNETILSIREEITGSLQRAFNMELESTKNMYKSKLKSALSEDNLDAVETYVKVLKELDNLVIEHKFMLEKPGAKQEKQVKKSHEPKRVNLRRVKVSYGLLTDIKPNTQISQIIFRNMPLATVSDTTKDCWAEVNSLLRQVFENAAFDGEISYIPTENKVDGIKNFIKKFILLHTLNGGDLDEIKFELYELE